MACSAVILLARVIPTQLAAWFRVRVIVGMGHGYVLRDAVFLCFKGWQTAHQCHLAYSIAKSKVGSGETAFGLCASAVFRLVLPLVYEQAVTNNGLCLLL